MRFRVASDHFSSASYGRSVAPAQPPRTHVPHSRATHREHSSRIKCYRKLNTSVTVTWFCALIGFCDGVIRTVSFSFNFYLILLDVDRFNRVRAAHVINKTKRGISTRLGTHKPNSLNSN